MQPAAAEAAIPGAAPLLQFRNLSKSFGGERALDAVDFEVRPGEVHGLLGQNGSGKSTLIKVLAGYHAPEPGAALTINGEPVALPLPPGGFRRFGVAFVHQQLGLIPSLTVTENLFIGDLAARNRWRISWRDLSRRAAELFAEFGLPIDPAVEVQRLPAVQRALLAIVRAVLEMRETAGERHRGLLVLDEPTPFLPKSDVDQLFRLIRGIVARGASVIFVSHDVDEVMEITDRATVLRDGRVAGTVATGGISADQLVEMIVGRRIVTASAAHRHHDGGDASVRIEHLTGGTLDDVSIAVHGGDVVGLTGLIGSGYDELPYLAFGAAPAAAGRLVLNGEQLAIPALDPARAIAAGIVLIPGDRQNAGAIGGLSVTDNVTMPVLGSAWRPWLLQRKDMHRRTHRLGEDFEVRPNRPEGNFDALSGGNQQKALLAKWLQTSPRLILLDEPTQGVDVGARQTVFRAIREMAGRGVAVLCASCDYDQLAQICDRVLVFSHGRIVSELTGASVTKENIAEHCYRSLRSGLSDHTGQDAAA